MLRARSIYRPTKNFALLFFCWLVCYISTSFARPNRELIQFLSNMQLTSLLGSMDGDPIALIPIPLETIRAGYNELGRLVSVALHTQQGDAARLGERRRDCLHLLQLCHQVRY